MIFVNIEFERSEEEMDETKKELESSLKRSKELHLNYESSQQELGNFRERNKELERQLKPSIFILFCGLLCFILKIEQTIVFHYVKI